MRIDTTSRREKIPSENCSEFLLELIAPKSKGASDVQCASILSRGPFLLEHPTILVVDLLYSILKKADAREQSVLTKP